MKEGCKRLQAVVLAAILCAAAVFPAHAADKTVSGISLRITSKLEAGTTLPDISYNNDGNNDVSDGDICISNSSDKYSIIDVDWSTSKSKIMDVGYAPEMKVTLAPNESSNYAFKGTYRSSNVTIRSGSFISASKKDGNLIVRIRVKAIEGTFPPPEDVYWKDNAKGTARWSEPEDGGTGRYEVSLRRGSTRVHTAETTSRTYNFYPYMTQAGTYTFRVRTIAKTSKQEDYGKSSEWVDSDEIYLAKEDVSDGSGRKEDNITSGGPGQGSGPVTSARVGWQQIGNSWYYYYPDGSYKQNGWEKVNGRWYLFQGDGRMLTGWQNLNNQTYYLDSGGAMVTGWVAWNGRWYYLNPTTDQFEGCLVKDRWIELDGKTYFLDVNGAMAEGWYQTGGNWYYFYPGSGQKAVNTTIDTFYVDANGVWVH
ncbi:MAG: N-acetylmuramoyl-L-alanine amidase family protein [Eubacteriales bacterium]|nr:N-acetylmuramoyl-L-alanine amidase family protein [Eubacteriales bacterium]